MEIFMREKYLIFRFVLYGQFFWKERVLFLLFASKLTPLNEVQSKETKIFDFVRVTLLQAAGAKHNSTQSLLSTGCTKPDLLGCYVFRMRKWISTPRVRKIKEL